MKYISTRGQAGRRPFCDILLEGLAPDGGLYLPEHYPQIDDAALTPLRQGWHDQGYAELAYQLLSLYIDDIPAADLRALSAKPRPRPACAVHQALPRRTLRQPLHRAPAPARSRPVAASTVQRPDAGLQGPGHAVAGPLVRVRTGAPWRATEHPGRHQRRHRQCGRIRAARQDRRARIHDQPGWPHD